MEHNSSLTKEELLIKINQLESKVSQLEESLDTTSQKLIEDSIIENNQFLKSKRQVTNRAIHKKEEAKKVLKQSEANVKTKLKAITEPQGTIGELELSDIIDVEVLQSIMNDFYQLTGMLGAVVDLSGNVLVAVGWQDICTKFHRCNSDTLKNCIESDIILTKGVPEGTFKAYRCKNNMWDIVTPIIVGEKHVGNVFMGQYFLQDEEPDIDFFKEQAKKYGFNEKEYLTALNRAPRFSKEEVNAGMKFYSKLAKLISNLSYSTIQQSKILAKQKISEQSLQESKERFELAMAAAKDGIYDWNFETNEIYYSPGWKNMLGYNDDELPNNLAVWKKLTEPKDLERSWNIIQQLINNQRNRFEIEYKMKHKNGHWVDILSRAEAVFNNKGKTIRMVGTHVDISERKLEEKILDIELKLFEYAVNHSEEELLQKFLDEAEKLTNSTIGFYHYIEEDQESISLQTWSSNTINSMCNRTTNVEHHYPISKAGVWVDCIRERKPVIHNHYVNLPHKKGLPEGHVPIVRELVVPVIRDNQIVAVLGVGNKNSNYNDTDVKITQRLADLAWETAIRKQAEEKLKNTFDISPSIIAKANVKTGYFVDVNQAVTRILGYSIEEFTSKPFMEFIHLEDRQRTLYEITEQMNGNKTTFFENRYLCKDGSYKWLAWHSTKADQHGIVTTIASDITGYKIAQLKLSQSTQLLEASQSIAKVGGWELDLSNNKLFWTAETYRIHDTSPEEFTCTVDKAIEFYLPKCQVIISEAVNTAIEKGKAFDLELQVKTNKGRIINVRVTAEVTLWNEIPIKLTGIFQDITEQKKAESKVRAAEEKLKNTFDISPSIIAKANVNTGCFADVNQAVTRILGYSIEEFTSKPFMEFIHLDDRQRTIDEITEQMNGNKTTFFENRYLCKDGSYKWLAWHSTKADQHGIVTAIASDITEQKKAEGNIRKLSTAVQQSPSIIVIADTKGKLEYVNPKFTELTGYTGSEAIGQASNILKSGKQDAEFYKELWTTVESGNVWRGQFRNKKKNGELFWEAASISAILNESGKIINFIKIGEDITQQKKTEEKLTIALEKALESDRLKSAFLSNMSHEIRTPMNGILGFINLLNKPNLSQSQISEYSAIINKSGDRLLNTINDIIDISKIEAGEVIISIAETPINTLIEELYSFFLPEATRKGLTLKLAPLISKENLSINTDSHKLHGILTNLIKNAIKYSKEGTITLGYLFKQNFIEFYVKDSGIGIPKNRLKAIFNRFEQADIEDSNVFEGSGLGLAISKAYTNMLGGEISVESTEGIGSTFKFTIPHNNKNIEMEKQFDYTENIISKIEHLNLLIVEDDVVSSYFLETILEDDFKKINIVENGIDAIEYCKNNQDVDLVLMDIKMPVMNGYDATKEIRKFNKNLLIIAQTAYAMQGDKEKAIEAGCNDYIVKPINKELLLKTIYKLIEFNDQ